MNSLNTVNKLSILEANIKKQSQQMETIKRKKSQKCFSGPKRGHFQQPEQQIKFLHLKTKADV